MRCRQPEKILFPPELSVLLAEPAELGSFLTGEQALVTGTGLATIDAGLPHPAGQAAGGKPKPLSNGIAGEALLRQSSTASAFCCAVNRRRVLLGLVINRQSGGHGVTPNDLSSKPGEAHTMQN